MNDEVIAMAIELINKKKRKISKKRISRHR